MATSTFSNLFGSSPVQPLQTHMASVQHCILDTDRPLDNARRYFCKRRLNT